MAFKDINHPPLWGIQHIPSGKLIRQFNHGYGHTQLAVEDDPSHPRVQNRVVLSPRLFTDEDAAKRALIQWLQGEHHKDWGGRITVYKPGVPRIKEEFMVVPIYLYTDAEEELYV